MSCYNARGSGFWCQRWSFDSDPWCEGVGPIQLQWQQRKGSHFQAQKCVTSVQYHFQFNVKCAFKAARGEEATMEQLSRTLGLFAISLLLWSSVTLVQAGLGDLLPLAFSKEKKKKKTASLLIKKKAVTASGKARGVPTVVTCVWIFFNHEAFWVERGYRWRSWVPVGSHTAGLEGLNSHWSHSCWKWFSCKCVTIFYTGYVLIMWQYLREE